MKVDSVGGITPVVLVTLSKGEKILSEHGLMLYKEAPVQVHRRTLKSLGVGTLQQMSIRAKAGSQEDYFLAEYEGPGNVTFSRDKTGEVRTMDLAQGQVVRIRAGHLMCFVESVKYRPTVLLQYQNPSDPNEIEYVITDELTGPGTIVYQSVGNIVTFNLNPGETVRTSVEALLMVSGTITPNLHWLYGGGNFTGNYQFPVVDLRGPGQALLHSGV
ncbi:MAG: AIM24 family protein [Nitrososphaerota archaeon]|nr:AIM24 family protein [Nitrososphaerota archaeon]